MIRCPSFKCVVVCLNYMLQSVANLPYILKRICRSSGTRSMRRFQVNLGKRENRLKHSLIFFDLCSFRQRGPLEIHCGFSHYERYCGSTQYRLFNFRKAELTVFGSRLELGNKEGIRVNDIAVDFGRRCVLSRSVSKDKYFSSRPMQKQFDLNKRIYCIRAQKI